MALIAVVEDSPVIWRLVRACLEPHRCEWAADGEKGLELVRRIQPELLVLDIGLPTMSGWDVADALKKDPRTWSVPILILTAHAAESNRERANVLGAAGFLTKPFNPMNLGKLVEEILGGQ